EAAGAVRGVRPAEAGRPLDRRAVRGVQLLRPQAQRRPRRQRVRVLTRSGRTAPRERAEGRRKPSARSRGAVRQGRSNPRPAHAGPFAKSFALSRLRRLHTVGYPTGPTRAPTGTQASGRLAMSYAVDSYHGDTAATAPASARAAF